MGGGHNHIGDLTVTRTIHYLVTANVRDGITTVRKISQSEAKRCDTDKFKSLKMRQDYQ